MRLLPKSLFGRLTLVLLVGLTITVLLSAGVQMWDRGRIIYEAIHNDVIERTVGIVQLLDAVPPKERERLLPLLSSTRTRIELASRPQETAASDSSSAGARLVYRQLRARLGPASDLGVALEGLGRLREAAAEFEEALRLRPDFAPARDGLARVRAGLVAGGVPPEP